MIKNLEMREIFRTFTLRKRSQGDKEKFKVLSVK